MKIRVSTILFLTFLFFVLASCETWAVPPAGPAGSVGIVIHGTATPNTTQQCSSNQTSCGIWPNCADISDLTTYCVNGHVIESYCSLNVIRNRTKRGPTCSNYIPEPSIGFNITNTEDSDEIVDLTIYNPGTPDIIITRTIDGFDSLPLSAKKVDLEFAYDDSNLKVKVKGLNISKLTSNKIHIVIDEVSPEIDGVYILRAYKVQLPNDFSYNSIDLTMTYNPDEVENESALVLYKCSNYNYQNDVCNGNWTKINLNINKESKIALANIMGFSVYALGEKESTTTTSTTTTTTPTTTTTVPQTTSTQSQSSSAGSSNAAGSSSTTTRPTTTQSTQPPAENNSGTPSTITNQTEESAKNPTGMFVLSSETIQTLAIVASIPIGALSLFLFRNHQLKEMSPKTYYKTHSKYNKKRTKQKRGETRLNL